MWGVLIMVLKFNLKRLLISLAIPLIVAGASALITGGNMQIYNDINRPRLSPPSALFPIVWSILYILMGVSLYLVWNREDTIKDKSTAYLFFALQLFFNFLWSPVFFSARQYLAAFVIIILLWLSIIGMIVSFSKISKLAALLQIPYLLWVTFAAYLNLGVFLLN